MKQSPYSGLTPEQVDELNRLLSMTSIAGNAKGTIIGGTLADLVNQQNQPAPEPKMPENYIQSSSGRVTDLGPSARSGMSGGVEPDYNQRVNVEGYNQVFRVKGDPYRLVTDTGQIIPLQRPTIEDEMKDLALRGQRAKVTAMERELAQPVGGDAEKAAAEAKAKSQVPGTMEYERIQKTNRLEKAEQSAWKGAVQQSEDITDYVDKVIGEGKYQDKGSKLGMGTTGLIGQITSNIGGMPARDLKGDIDRIKANLGFKELQEMRKNSPTGGALGQVAVRELEFLQSVEGALDQAQSQDQLASMLKDIKASTQRLRQDLIDNPPAGVKPDKPAKPSKDEWIAAARQANPNRSGAELEAFYMKKYGR